MGRILRFAAGLLVVAALVIGGVLLVARGSDGPMGPIAGGPFASGVLHEGAEPNWSFVANRETVQFQLLDPHRSRTTWILEHDGRIFIPCGYMDTAWGRLWKHWPIEAERDGRALLRIGRTLYARHLERVSDGPVVAPLVAELVRKYDVPASVEAVSSGSLWLFELRPRTAAAR